MQNFQKALIYQDAYDESTKALKFAAAIASEESLFKVFDVQPPLSAFWHDLIDDDFEDTPSYHRHQSLRELVRRFAFAGGEVATEVKRGRPVVQVVETVSTEGHQIVIKEAHSKVSDYLFGSIDFRLIRYCPVPLYLMHPNSAVRPERIMIAINPEATGEEVGLNERLVRLASELANHFHCKLAVVAAFQTPSAMLGHTPEPELLQRFEKREKEYRRRCRASLQDILISSLKPIKPQNIFIDSGRPSEVVLNVVDEFNPDVLVIGSVARQGIAGLLIGNTAERVLRSVDCSVLTIKPDGFKSPIA